MGAQLTIESLYDQAWEIHGDNYRQAMADRDNFRSQSRDRLGPEVAAEVQRHVDAALGRLLADDLPDLDPAAKRAFHQLHALEMAVMEIEARVEAGNTFFDPYNASGLLPTLGMSWWDDVVPLLPENPGFMPLNKVERFLAMVTTADHRVPSGGESDGAADVFRKRRQELIEFLERAVELDEAIWCDL